jgi:hypothetical protein
MTCQNLTDREITLNDALFTSGVTGQQIHPKISVPGKYAEISEVNPIPPGAFFSFVMPLGPPDGSGITSDEFLKTWGPFSFQLTYNDGKIQRLGISRDQAVQMVTAPKSIAPFPHVTLKHPVKGVGN